MKWRFDTRRLVEPDPLYQAKVDGWLSGALASRPETWQTLLRLLPGVFPTDAWAGLDRLGYPVEQLGAAAPSDYDGDTASAYRVFSSVEHPADFEWRFTGEGIAELCRIAADILHGHPAPSAACFGCPSVFVAGMRDLPAWGWALFDRRAHLLTEAAEEGVATRCDLCEPLPPAASIDLAFVDPPWYNPITKCFLANACRILKSGGVVLLSMPAAGTRTSAEFDLDEILEWCPTQGLEHEATIRAALPYSTPYFERRSLQAAGFSAEVPSWRKGDLIVLKLRQPGRGVPSPFGRMGGVPPFQEIWIKGVKFVVTGSTQHDARLPERPFIEAVWAESTLPSVSTRFPGRSQANIITSGNRFLRCGNVEMAVRHLTALARGRENETSADDDLVPAELEELVERETSELAKYNESFR